MQIVLDAAVVADGRSASTFDRKIDLNAVYTSNSRLGCRSVPDLVGNDGSDHSKRNTTDVEHY